MEWLPKDIIKFVTYPTPESMKLIEHYLKKNIKNLEGIGDSSLLDWSIDNYVNKNLFSSKIIDDLYLRIYKRPIFDGIREYINLNGCCIPGQRKIYCTVDGNFKICERVGEIPYIGNIETGVDLNIIRNIYLDGYNVTTTP